MNIGAQLLKQVANKTNDVAGDGTTTSTILARALFKEGCKSVAAGMNPMDLRRGMNMATDAIVGQLKEMSVPVQGKEQICHVATISANGDKDIGSLLSTLMEKVGDHGSITVADGKTLNHEIEFVEGMKFDRGFISPYFVTNQKAQKVEFEDAYILMTDKKIQNVMNIVKFLEHSMKDNRPLLIICEDIESEALATLVVNKYQKGLQVCVVKAPAFGDNRKAIMNDIAILTGGTVVSEEVGLVLDKAEPNVLGIAKNVVMSKDDTVIMDGRGDKAVLLERVAQIKDQLSETTSEYDKEKLQERLAKL